MIESDRSATEKNKSKCKSSEGQWKFVTAISHESVVKVNFGDGDTQIDANGKGSRASEEAQQHEHATKELGKGREVCGPSRQSKAGDELSVVVKAAKNFLITVAHHDGAKCEPHDEQRKWLETIKVAQESSANRHRRLP